MIEKKIDMNNPLEFTYKNKPIYIYKEVFGIRVPYVICSYTSDHKRMFKLNKSEL